MSSTNLNTITRTGFLPSPANPIGFANFDLIDASRTDCLNKTCRKKINVSVWYPAETNDPKCRKKYYDGDDSIGRGGLFNSKFGFAQLCNSNLWTNSYENASVSERRDRYPVLLFSHDLENVPKDYTALMEHLASEGYFVFSINHSSGWGKDSSVKPTRSRIAAWWMYLKITMKAKFLLLKAERHLMQKTYEQKWKWSRTNLHLWDGLKNVYSEIVRDRAFLLDFLSGVASRIGFNEYPYNLFAQRIDTQNIGAIGHGWGGAAAIDSLVIDKRTVAALNIDGFQFSEVKDRIIEKPMFLIYSQQYTGINAGIYFTASDADIHTISGARHRSFTDAPFLRKDEAHNQHIIYDVAALAVNFFDRHLKKVDHLAALGHNNQKRRPTVL